MRELRLGAAGLLLLCVGCTQSMIDGLTAETVTDARRNHEITRQSVVAHDDNMSEQHKTMSPEDAEAITVSQAEFAARMTAIEEKAQEVHSSVTEHTGELLGIGLTLASRFSGLPVGSIVATVTGAVDEVEEAMRGDLAVVSAELQAKFDALDAETRDKLAATTQEQHAMLLAAKDDRVAFETIMRNELKLKDDEIEALKGLSTDEILALIAAAGGAAGLGIAGGRTGKSRSAAEIAALHEKINGLTKT